MSESVTLKSYFYEVLIPSSQKNTSSPIEDILHHVSISFMKKLALYKCFNPRTHTGCDRPRRNCCRSTMSFNPRTHTGCDYVESYKTFLNERFQSTHPHGVRLSEKMIMLFMARFQSTHPHGVRHWPGSPIFSCQSRFNPRTHTGCDLSCSPSISKELFQSTHPHGVRRLTLAYYKPRP